LIDFYLGQVKLRILFNDDYLWDFFFLGLKKRNEEEIHEERDAFMRSEYFDPIEHFPEKIDQLLNALNRVCLILILYHLYLLFVHFLVLYDTKN